MSVCSRLIINKLLITYIDYLYHLRSIQIGATKCFYKYFDCAINSDGVKSH